MADFDPSGVHMPVGPARHIEFALSTMKEKPDIRLAHLALTHDQVLKNELPSVPLKKGSAEKKGDSRAAGFEKRYGSRAVEINALLELYPEKFEQILRDAIRSLRDSMSGRSPTPLPKLRRPLTKLRRDYRRPSSRVHNPLLGALCGHHRVMRILCLPDCMNTATRMQNANFPRIAAVLRGEKFCPLPGQWSHTAA